MGEPVTADAVGVHARPADAPAREAAQHDAAHADATPGRPVTVAAFRLHDGSAIALHLFDAPPASPPARGGQG